MKYLFAIAVIFMTYSTLKCAKNIENKMSTETVATTIALSAEEEERSDFDLMAIMVDCNDTFRIEMGYLESLNKSGSFPDETDRTPKCYVRCVLERTEVASEEGEFNVTRTADVFTKIRDIPQEEIIKIASDCSDRSESCKCERSYQYIKCMLETTIDRYETSD